MFKPHARKSKKVSTTVSVNMPKKSWEALLIEIGEWSVHYSTIKKQLSVYSTPLKTTTLTKKQIKIQSEKSPLTKAAEKFRSEQIAGRGIYEKIAMQAVKELKLPYTLQKIFFYGTNFYIADLYLPKYKIILEIDGSQHYTDEGLTKDGIRTENLLELGINKVVRISNKLCTTSNVKKALTEAIESLEELEMEKL